MNSTFANVVARRDLLRELTLADLRSQSQVSRLGWLWWVVDPLVMMLIYWVVVAGIFGRGERYAPYPVFILCAMLPWKHFTSSLNAASGVLRASESLIKSIAFPTMALPITQVLARFWHHLFGLLVLFATSWIAGLPLGLALVQLPLLLVFQLVLVLGLSLLVACFGALIRDLKGFLGHVMRVGFYLSPTLYGIDLVREQSANLGGWMADWLPRLFLLNPFAVLIGGYRDVFFFNRMVEPEMWALLTVQSFGALWLGYRVYLHFDRRVIKFL